MIKEYFVFVAKLFITQQCTAIQRLEFGRKTRETLLLSFVTHAATKRSSSAPFEDEVDGNDNKGI
jgi:hypothetical protein